MGWTLSGEVEFQFQGQPTRCHARGNNLAWVCPACGHPLLFTYQNGKQGSSATRPVVCPEPNCQAQFHLTPEYGTQQEPPAGQFEVPAPVMLIVQH